MARKCVQSFLLAVPQSAHAAIEHFSSYRDRHPSVIYFNHCSRKTVAGPVGCILPVFADMANLTSSAPPGSGIVFFEVRHSRLPVFSFPLAFFKTATFQPPPAAVAHLVFQNHHKMKTSKESHQAYLHVFVYSRSIISTIAFTHSLATFHMLHLTLKSTSTVPR